MKPQSASMSLLHPSTWRAPSGQCARRLAAAAWLAVAASLALPATAAPAPDFGPNVIILDPSMPQAQIQSTVDAVAARQLGNQFGSERYALLFKPGTYGSTSAPLNFQVGYYTAVAGLGRSPGDVVTYGSINVYNQCDSGGCVALDNFWRSLSNLTVNVANQTLGCHSGEFWAVSQAAPMRRVHVNGLTTLMDYCTGPSFASGGFIADSRFDGSTVVNGSQQQWLVRNSELDGWTNGVWNQVFSGVTAAPAPCFPAAAACGGPYTVLPTSPVTREAPYLYVDAQGDYHVFVPAVRRNSSGTSWSTGTEAGTTLDLGSFFIARPGDPAERINAALASGMNLLLTPGIYPLDQPLRVVRAGTVVLGLGFPTLVPQQGNAALAVLGAGAEVAGLLVDAGPQHSPLLMWVGGADRDDDDGDGDAPTALHDVFFRIGGATAGSAGTSLLVTADGVILDDIWAWRADHGNGVGWTANTADHGLIVTADDVTAYGLFVEHYQKQEVIWTGERGTVVFFQNEMPYDPPSQAAWSESASSPGYPALRVGEDVTRFRGYGMGSYSFFNQGVPIQAANAFEVPSTLPAGSLSDLLTIFLDASHGSGGILNVVNGVGGASSAANADQPVTVIAYP